MFFHRLGTWQLSSMDWLSCVVCVVKLGVLRLEAEVITVSAMDTSYYNGAQTTILLTANDLYARRPLYSLLR